MAEVHSTAIIKNHCTFKTDEVEILFRLNFNIKMYNLVAVRKKVIYYI